MSTYSVTYPVTRAVTYAPSRALLGTAGTSTPAVAYIITFDDPDTTEYILAFNDPDTNEYILTAEAA